jgi:hypothetical protein
LQVHPLESLGVAGFAGFHRDIASLARSSHRNVVADGCSECDATFAAIDNPEHRGFIRARHRVHLAIHKRECIPVREIRKLNGLSDWNRLRKTARPGLIDGEAVIVGVASRTPARIVVEQSKSDALKGLELKHRLYFIADILKCTARAVTERGCFSIEVAVDPKPNVRTIQRLESIFLGLSDRKLPT